MLILEQSRPPPTNYWALCISQSLRQLCKSRQPESTSVFSFTSPLWQTQTTES